MSYSQPWSEVIPNGATTLASTIDVVFQQLRRDIRERMNTLVNDWTTDPVTTKFGCRLYLSAAAQSIPSGTITSINWDGEVFNNGAIHSTSTNTSRVTVPANGAKGVWLLDGQATFQANATGVRNVFLAKNGVAFTEGIVIANGSTYAPSVKVTALVNAPIAGDYYELQVQQDSGGALNVLNRAFGLDTSYFNVMQLLG